MWYYVAATRDLHANNIQSEYHDTKKEKLARIVTLIPTTSAPVIVDIDTINHCGTASGFETEVRPDFVHSKIEAEENTINCEILHLLSLALKGLQLAVTTPGSGTFCRMQNVLQNVM